MEQKLSFTRICFLSVILFISQAVDAQQGRVGINTNTPLAALHVADSSVVFTGPDSFVYPDFNIYGPGVRMMWVAPRYAFRAGYVSGDRWDPNYLGYASFATGIDSRATGYGSVSMGQNSIAHSGTPPNIAIGYNNQAGVFSGNFGGCLALGSYTIAAQTHATAMGIGTQALGGASLAMGSSTLAIGGVSTASGYGTRAYGIASFVAGYNNVTNAFASFTIGQYADTIVADRDSWVLTDPLFVVANGTAANARKNALTVLKNGNTGIGTKSPTSKLHVVNNNPEDGGWAEGIVVENDNPDPGEAAITFANTSIPADRQWMAGMDQNPKFSIAYGTTLTSGNTHFVIDTTGRAGIGTINPVAPLHVVRNSPSGGPFHGSAVAILESNNISYLQLSNEDLDETGILSGNQQTDIRSAIIFRRDSSIHFRAGGNNTRMAIHANGDVGIGMSANTPQAKLHVNGTVRLGLNGTTLNEIIKTTVAGINLPNVVAGTTLTQSFTVTNAALNSVVSVSQDAAFNSGFVIASARVSAVDTVEVRFINVAATDYNPPAMDFHFTLIR